MNPSDAVVIETLDELGPQREEALRFLLAGERDSSRNDDRRLARLFEHLEDQALRIGAVTGHWLRGGWSVRPW